MLETLKIIHFLGLILGIGGGIANAIAATKLSGLPPQARPVVGGFRAALGKMSTIGLVLLWLTGISLLVSLDTDILLSDQTFLLKLAAVIVLTGFSVTANMTVMSARRSGKPPEPARMKKIGIGATVFGLLALVLAVLAFA
ncbi:MAG: hypothetical protein ACU0C9_09345 [Paracoccaceae bacterium]